MCFMLSPALCETHASPRQRNHQRLIRAFSLSLFSLVLLPNLQSLIMFLPNAELVACLRLAHLRTSHLLLFHLQWFVWVGLWGVQSNCSSPAVQSHSLFLPVWEGEEPVLTYSWRWGNSIKNRGEQCPGLVKIGICWGKKKKKKFYALIEFC